MSRTADQAHRAALLDRIVSYVAMHGVSDLSLRPLAQAVGSSPRVLLYYFGSKEEMIVEVLARARVAQRSLFAKMQERRMTTPGDVCRAIWSIMSAPESEALFRLFFEVYALALVDRKRFATFLEDAVEDWLDYLTEPRIREGYKRADARAIATLTLGAFRGFMLDLCATRDRKRVNRAFELWLLTYEHLPSAKELAA